MSPVNTRKWSTPVVIGAGLFVAVSGVLMFLGVHNPLEAAHEWIGLVFAAGILLHVLNHWRSFRNYFSQRLALSVVASVAIVTSVLITSSMMQQGGSPMAGMIQSFEQSPLTEVAPLLDQAVGNIIAEYEASGIRVVGPGSSIAEIATANDIEPKQLVSMLFK